jgi:hypothetical protein
MKKVILIMLIVSLLFSCTKKNDSERITESSRTIKNYLEEKHEETITQKKLIITDDLLYNCDIWKIDREYENGSPMKIMDELKRRVMQKNDKKAFDRLAYLSGSMDGDLAEYYSKVMGDIFKFNAKYFLQNTYDLYDAETIYMLVIHHNYMDVIDQKKYPKNYKEIQSYGSISKSFIETYEYYLKNGL